MKEGRGRGEIGVKEREIKEWKRRGQCVCEYSEREKGKEREKGREGERKVKVKGREKGRRDRKREKRECQEDQQER